ncbi:MAG: GNAT family N-acetyltransferase [Candidatus Thorarchaeota archaeon]
MLSSKEIKHLQEFLLNSWPAEHYFFLNGWIARFDKGVTYRANSVFPISYTADQHQIVGDIEIIENAYKQYGLPSIFTMHDSFEPKDLDEILKERGYTEHDPTNALISSFNEIKINKDNTDFEYVISNERTTMFSNLLAEHTQRDQSQQRVIDEIVKRINIPKKCFIVAKKQNDIIGTVMGVLNSYGYIYVADLFVLPNYRRIGVASSLMSKLINDWAIPNRFNYIWLQVEKENNQAIKFYEQMGMKKAYSYYYLKKEILIS